MNLRKLLCGLLALCLLLTMAPAALMEEAAVEEQVVELGGEEVASDAVEAEDYKVIDFDKAEDGLVLPTSLVKYSAQQGYSGETFLAVGEDLEIEAEEDYAFIVKDVKINNVRFATCEADESTITVTGLRAGKAVLSVKMLDKYGITVKCAVTINVYDAEKAGAVQIYYIPDPVEAEDEGYIINGETIGSVDVSKDIAIAVTAGILPEGIEQAITWSSDKKSVAVPNNSVTLPGELNTILLKGKGTATITAKCGTVKATFKVKVTDDYAPKSIKITGNSKVNVGKVVPLTSVVSPRPYADMYVSWELDNTKYAKFYDEDNDVILSSKKVAGDSVLLYGISEGTAKITAKTYNGKKTTFKLKVEDASKPNKIGIYGFMPNEKFEVERYDEEYFMEYDKLRNNTFLIVPVLYDKNNNEIDVEDALNQYANVQWKSSNSKVASVKIFKDYYGYSQDYVAEDIFGNDVAYLMDDHIEYAAIVECKDTGTTTLTAKTKDGKKSVKITLKVVNSHDADEILFPFGKTVEVATDEYIDLAEYVEVVPGDFYGTLTIEPSHSTSKLTKIDGTLYRTNKKGDVTIKVKAGGKSKTFTLKIK